MKPLRGEVESRAGWRSAKWYAAASLACSLGSIVARGFALSLAGRAAMAVAKGERIPEDFPLMEGLFNLVLVLAFGGLVLGVPVVRYGNSVSRVAVAVAFLAAVVFMFVMV